WIPKSGPKRTQTTSDYWRRATHRERPTPDGLTQTLLLRSGDIHPNPGPKSPKLPNLRIIQLNINGLNRKLPELTLLIKAHKPHIITLQETKLSTRTKTPRIPDYAAVRSDRPSNNGGGLIIYIHRSIPYNQIPTPQLPDYAQHQAINFYINRKPYTLFNFYIPPPPNPTSHYHPDINSFIIHPNPIITGDFNAHHPLWLKTQPSDIRGTAIEEHIQNGTFLVLNTHSPTRIAPNQRPTSPDLTITTPELAAKITWQPLPKFSSDHLPLQIDIAVKVPQTRNPKSTYTNFKKANWPAYTLKLESLLTNYDPNTFSTIDQAEKALRTAIITAAKDTIPQGKRNTYIPNYNPEITKLIEEIPYYPPCKQQTLPHPIKQKRWNDFVSKIDRKTSPSLLWHTIKAITNNTPVPTEIIKQAHKIDPNPKAQATALIKHYSSISKFPTPKEFPETQTAIVQLTNSKALGPDQLCNLHLKHLGCTAIAAITALINRSLSTAQTYHDTLAPQQTRRKTPQTQTKQYPDTPPDATWLSLPNVHHNCSCRSNTNLSQASINLNHQPEQLLNYQTIPNNHSPHYLRWLTNFLLGRKSLVKLQNTLSAPRSFPNGVPQGSVLSPTLFTFYINDIPTPPEPLKMITYADDITVLSPHPNSKTATTNLQQYLPTIEHWATLKHLKISPDKSTVTLLTPDPAEYSRTINLQLNQLPIPTEKHPKILGLTLDPKLTFNTHTTAVIEKATRRIHSLKAIASHTWGQDKETLTLLYKQYIRSVLEYASPAWFPTLSQTNLQKLKTLENRALRIATGCILMTDIPHLHSETQTLPLPYHSDLLGAQFFARISDPQHPTARAPPYLNPCPHHTNPSHKFRPPAPNQATPEQNPRSHTTRYQPERKNPTSL
ncbi:Tcoingi protein-like protein, partial [Dinothrombium tinctorium]